jgi:type III secretory pathway component EscR
MIVGLRLEFCLSDIVSGIEKMEDVYCIIADGNVNFRNMDQVTHWWDKQLDPWRSLLSQGKNSLHLYEFEDVYQTMLVLMDEGKIAFKDYVLPSAFREATIRESHDPHWFDFALREKDMEPAV